MPSAIDSLCQLVTDPKTTPEQFDLFLKEHKLEIDQRSSDLKIQPLIYALSRGSVALVRHIVEDLHASLTATSELSLFLIAAQAKPEILEYALDSKNPLGACLRESISPFHIDLARADMESMALKLRRSLSCLLEESGVEHYPLMIAVHLKRLDLAEWLLGYSEDFIKECRHKKNFSALSKHYQDLGYYYLHGLNNYKKADFYYEKAVFQAEKVIHVGLKLTAEKMFQAYRLLRDLMSTAYGCKRCLALSYQEQNSFSKALEEFKKARAYLEKMNSWSMLVPDTLKDEEDLSADAERVRDLAISYGESASLQLDRAELARGSRKERKVSLVAAQEYLEAAIYWYDRLATSDQMLKSREVKAMLVMLKKQLEIEDKIVIKGKEAMRQSLALLNRGQYREALKAINSSIEIYLTARFAWRNAQFNGYKFYRSYYSELSLTIASLKNSLAYSLEALGDESFQSSSESSSSDDADHAKRAYQYYRNGNEFYQKANDQRQKALRFFDKIPQECRNKLYHDQYDMGQEEMELCKAKLKELDRPRNHPFFIADKEEENEPRHSTGSAFKMSHPSFAEPAVEPPAFSL